ncbi:tetratricopeptide repeat protein, partial [Paracoccus nototheniae]
ARPAPDLSQAEPDYLAMIDQLREAVGRNPDDPQGQQLLATHEMRLGNLAAAQAAQARLVELRGDQADAVELMQLASLMVETAGGLVTPEAEAVLARALTLDPDQPQARYLQGVMLIQNGRPDRAFPIWRRLLEEGPEGAPWIPSIRAAIEELAWLAGEGDYQPPAPQATDMPGLPGPDMPGPDAQDLAAIEDMSPEDRQQMIEGMVSGLQQRLATEGGAPDEWARLISALYVLGRNDQADAILTEARQRFADIPEALAVVEAAGAAANRALDQGAGAAPVPDAPGAEDGAPAGPTADPPASDAPAPDAPSGDTSDPNGSAPDAAAPANTTPEALAPGSPTPDAPSDGGVPSGSSDAANPAGPAP